jgi:hypothetical protein
VAGPWRGAAGAVAAKIEGEAGRVVGTRAHFGRRPATPPKRSSSEACGARGGAFGTPGTRTTSPASQAMPASVEVRFRFVGYAVAYRYQATGRRRSGFWTGGLAE